MAATSPYTPNDYQAVSNFRPYELPINDIFKGLTAQNQFWEAGAARVKAVYDNALNLKLSLEPNKEIRKKYLEDAEKQLTKLSAMDLSDPTVQRQGFAVFKPLFQDEGIIYDDLSTRHYEKVRNDALMYRSKDNGKGYSDINLQYAMDGYNEFINSQDRMAGKAAYGKRREYTPFYDYTEDFSKALKDCKPSSVEVQSPSYGASGSVSGYMKETYAKTLSAAQARGCLEAGLSGNAQRQLQIEGYVAYKNNLPTLAADTGTYLSSVSTNLSSELQKLSASKAAIANRKDLSTQEKAELSAAIDTQMKSVSQELDRTSHSIDKINSGDFTDVQNNFDTYAGSMYSYKKLYKKAMASSFDERREVYKADPVQLASIRFSQEKYLKSLDNMYDRSLHQMDHDFEREMKMLDLVYGNHGKGGTGSGADVFRNPLTGEITVNSNLLPETPNLYDKPEADDEIYGKLTQQVSELNKEDEDNNLTLYNNMVSRAERDTGFRESLLKGFNYGTTTDEWSRFKKEHANNKFATPANTTGGLHDTDWFKTYTKGKPDDEDVNKWSYQNTVIETGMNVLNRKIELGEAQVANELGGTNTQQLDTKLAKLKPVVVDGVTITPQDIRMGLEGRGDGKIVVKKSPSWVDTEGNLHNDGYDYYLNGKKMDAKYFTTGGGGPTEFNNLRQKVESASSQVTNAVRKKRAEVYNNLGFDREPWFFTPEDKAPLIQTLKSILPKDDKNKEMDVTIISSDFSGGVRVSVPGAKEGDDKYLDLIRKAGVGTSVESTGDGVITIRGTNYNVIPQAIQNPILGQAAFQLSSIGQTQVFQQTQPGAKVQNADIKVPVMIRGKQESMTIETYKNKDRPEFRVYIEGATDHRPLIIASNPYELFEKIGRSPVDLNKPIN